MDHLFFLCFTIPSSSNYFLCLLATFSIQLLLLSQVASLPFSSVATHNTSSSNCLHHEKSLLLQLKHGFIINRSYSNSSSKLDSWNLASNCCSWDGITCDEATGHVIGLDLCGESMSWIEGRIDPSLFRLRSLQKLNLSWNYFYPHPIPSGLGHLTNLTHLNLSLSSFTGQIPLEITRLTKLVSLDISSNYLKLKNPNLSTLIGNLSNLQELFLDRVNISEEHGGKWAQDLSIALPNLHRLSLRDCGLQGPIDHSLFRIPDLSQLSLDGNNLSSIVGLDFVGDSSALTSLTLSGCGLCGKILESIFLMPNLQILDISHNPLLTIYLLEFPRNNALRYLKLGNCNLFGSLPSSIANLTQLEHLDLSLNDFSCAVLSSIANLTQLEFLDLSSNNLSGTIPLSFGNTLQHLSTLFLEYNSLEGSISSSLFSHPALRYLSLSHNQFSGMIPSSIANLTQLESLELSSNNFNDVVPSSIANLTQLEHLYLSSNDFSGMIPSSIANLTQLEYLDLSSNNFSGTIPSSFGDQLKHLISLYLYDNSLEGSIPSSLLFHPVLRYLYLSYNQFSGYLPDSHKESSSMLEAVAFSYNKLQGPIPRLIFGLAKLRYLHLSNNNFSGTISLDMFKNFKNFLHLDLSNNNLTLINSNSSPHLIPSSQIYSLYLCSCNINEFPNIIQNLNQLKYLDLSKNKIHGEIPTWIWEVGNGSLYHLNLSNNFLESFEHPLHEFSSSSLGVIDLHSNRLQGSLPILSYPIYFQDYSNNNFSSIIPAEINLTSTRFFFLSGNNVSGEIPLSICKAHFLQILDLSKNNFSGKIPTCLGKIGNSLKILNLQRNSFHGTVPNTFEKECSLRTLNLDNNDLEGPIPKSLANCKTLEVIDLGNNHLNDTFPFWYASLSYLRILILRSNKFHGPIAHSHAKNSSFQFLQIFDISSNSFGGIVPPNFFLNWELMTGGAGSTSSSNNQIVNYQLSGGIYYQDSVMVTMKGLDLEVVKIITAMTSVDLSNNRFEGEIPASICNLKLLHVLNLSHNDFNGLILASLENLTQLESLDLSRNKLSGTIPWQLTKLTFLAVLDLSQNLLYGRIPQSQQFLTFSNSSFLGNIGLCGPPLTNECVEMTVTPPLTFNGFGLDGDREIDLEFMWIGFGVGFGFGLGAIFWTLALWKKGSRKYMKLIDRMFVHNFSMIA